MAERLSKKLEDLRKRIDRLDDKIIGLLDERAQLALLIGKLKTEKGTEPYSPDRESEIYAKLSKVKASRLSSDALKSIYREIMSATLALEKAVQVAYLGPEATFTHLASLSKFGSSVEYIPCASIPDVFDEVAKNRATYGVVPIENTMEGAVSHTLDMFIDSELKICSEIIFEVSHNLMSNSSLSQIRRIYSNPQVFGQCRLWLKAHLPKAELIETSTTTQGAVRAAQEEGSAAIGSSLAATLYNLKILADGIEDTPHNRTRFLVIGRQIAKKSQRTKTSIVVSIKDKVGALYEILEPIQKHRINMTKIESRPSKKKAWDYYFFIDMEGHVEDRNVRETLREMEEKVRFLKVLGSYPALKEE